VMFLNQDGRAPISTHPARAHKHAAPQTVPTNHQVAIEKDALQRINFKLSPIMWM
jgi:hypothetical protein